MYAGESRLAYRKMCIRDSYTAQMGTRWNRLAKKPQEDLNKQLKQEPVSYTHLDVYKRQSSSRGYTSKREAGKNCALTDPLFPLPVS